MGANSHSKNQPYNKLEDQPNLTIHNLQIIAQKTLENCFIFFEVGINKLRFLKNI